MLVPLYNKAPWVLSTIESVLQQTHTDFELIIIDDGSTDGSTALIADVHDERIRFFARDNRGANATRNELLDAAKGRYIQFLDADDLLLPHKLERQVAALETGASVSISQVAMDKIDGARRPTSIDAPLTDIVIGDGVPTPGPLHRKATLESVGGWNNNLPASQEFDLHLRLLVGGHWDQAVFTDEPLAIWRRVPESTTANELSVYRSKVIALQNCLPDAPESVLPALAGSLANAARHLARGGKFSEAEAALSTALDLDSNSLQEYPARIRWIPHPAVMHRAERLDSLFRRMLKGGGSSG